MTKVTPIQMFSFLPVKQRTVVMECNLEVELFMVTVIQGSRRFRAEKRGSKERKNFPPYSENIHISILSCLPYTARTTRTTLVLHPLAEIPSDLNQLAEDGS